MVSHYTAKGDSFTYSKPLLWADKQLLGSVRPSFDIAPDGKRFAVFARPEEKQWNVHVTFLLNFFATWLGKSRSENSVTRRNWRTNSLEMCCLDKSWALLLSDDHQYGINWKKVL